VIYAVSVPQVRDLLAAARQIIRGVLAEQEHLMSELELTVGASGR
jgi:ArsR family transcriptional regulator